MGRYVPYVVALAAVVPLIAINTWTGFRLAFADPVLAVLSPTEQALSVRSPGGQWAMLVALAWFALAYWRRNVRWWEIACVVFGGAAVLIRAGNAWLDAIALLVPLARQISLTRVSLWLLGGVAAVSLAYAAVIVSTTRPPALPGQALDVAAAAPGGTTVFADWRWARQLQQRMGDDRRVLAAGGLASESPDFWLNYVRIVNDYEQWPAELRALDADLLVLDSENSTLADQVRASSEWRVLYDTGTAFVAERST
jgi:hypothetical protein